MDSDYMEGYIMGTVVTFLITAVGAALIATGVHPGACLLYTSPSPRDATLSRMPSSA